MGVIAAIPSAGGADCNTLVEAVEHGWWYSAHTPSGARAGIFFTDADAVQRLGIKSSAEWLHCITHTQLIGSHLRKACCRIDTVPQVLLADTSRLDCAAGDGWVAVGDAASALDPLSSLGLTAPQDPLLSTILAVSARSPLSGSKFSREQGLASVLTCGDTRRLSFLRHPANTRRFQGRACNADRSDTQPPASL